MSLGAAGAAAMVQDPGAELLVVLEPGSSRSQCGGADGLAELLSSACRSSQGGTGGGTRQRVPGIVHRGDHSPGTRGKKKREKLKKQI